MRQINSFFDQQVNLQRGHLFPWAPVLFAVGIGTYFSLRFEPDRTIWTGLALAIAGCLAIRAVTRDWGRPVALGLMLVLAGFAIAGAKAHRVAEVKLGFRYYGAIEGRIIKVD